MQSVTQEAHRTRAGATQKSFSDILTRHRSIARSPSNHPPGNLAPIIDSARRNSPLASRKKKRHVPPACCHRVEMPGGLQRGFRKKDPKKALRSSLSTFSAKQKRHSGACSKPSRTQMVEAVRQGVLKRPPWARFDKTPVISPPTISIIEKQ